MRRGNFASAAVGIYPAIDGHIGIHAMPKNWPQLLDAIDAAVDGGGRALRRQPRAPAQRRRSARRNVHAGRPASRSARRTSAAGALPRADLAREHRRGPARVRAPAASAASSATIEHPVAGTLRTRAHRRACRRRRRSRAARRCSGEHNADVYAGMLGLAPRDLVALRAQASSEGNRLSCVLQGTPGAGPAR